jgi:hypothetical protein
MPAERNGYDHGDRCAEPGLQTPACLRIEELRPEIPGRHSGERAVRFGQSRRENFEREPCRHEQRTGCANEAIDVIEGELEHDGKTEISRRHGSPVAGASLRGFVLDV